MKQHINGIEVKSTNYKKYAALLESYYYVVNTRGYRMVYDCYIKPSAAKDAAENTIWLQMKERSGYGYTVVSYNTMVFTCAYLFQHPEDGNLILCYKTPSHTYYIDAAGL